MPTLPLAIALALTAQSAIAQPATAQPAPAEPAPIPSLEEATSQIIAQDSALFWAVFEGCNPAALKDLLTKDYRMLHDRGGLTLDGRAAFVASMEGQCALRQTGGSQDSYANRRLAVPGSRQVTPLGDWGVLERGWHTFHERRQRPAGENGLADPGGEEWVQVGGARYMHVWQWIPAEGRFRLDESISVDHDAATPYPPAAARAM